MQLEAETVTADIQARMSHVRYPEKRTPIGDSTTPVFEKTESGIDLHQQFLQQTVIYYFSRHTPRGGA